MSHVDHMFVVSFVFSDDVKFIYEILKNFQKIKEKSEISMSNDDLHPAGMSIPSSSIPIESTSVSLSCAMSPMESIPLPTNDLSMEKSKQFTTNIDELPFEFLPGEEPIADGLDLTDGSIYLTTFRLFIFFNKTSCSFINCPLRLIESVEIKDNLFLYVQSKDFRSFRLPFFTTEKCCQWLRKLVDSLANPTSLDDLFALKFAAAVPQHDHYVRDRFNDELNRLQLDAYPWRATDVNLNFKLCPTYPERCVVPSSITDDEINEVAKFRSYRRFPTIVWR